MATIPKNLAFKLYFRKKTKTRKFTHRKLRLRQLSKKKPSAYCTQLSIFSFRKVSVSKTDYKQISPSLFNRGKKFLVSNCSSFPKGEGNSNKYLLVKNNNSGKQQNWSVDWNSVYPKKQTHLSLVTNKLLFGSCGISFTQYATISAKYIDTVKLDIAKILKKKGRVWARVCCDTPVSARPAESRMGKGKGSVSYWVAKVEPGQLLFEFSGITKVQLKGIFDKLRKKTSVDLKIVN